MAKEKLNKTKSIKNEQIIETITEAINSCYGVSNFVSRSNEDNTKGKALSGVSIRKHTDHTYSVDIYVAMASDIKITEALREAQKQVRYKLDTKYPEKFRNVNVFASEVVLK